MSDDYKNTFWKSKSHRHKYGIFAVVKQSGSNLIAWELEQRSGGIYHPAYGLIPKSYISDFDMFVSNGNGKAPEFIISLQDSQVYCAGLTIKQVLGEESKSIF